MLRRMWTFGRSGLTLAVLAALVVGAPPPAQAVAVDTSAPGPYAVGSTDVTVTAPGRSFGARVYYPATAAGANRPVAAGEFGVIAFGHGFLQGVSKYTSTLNHLASWGFIVAAPTSQGSLSTNHSAFADDLNATLAWIVVQDATPGSRFATHVDEQELALAGHSMGGGASVLAAARNRAVTTVVNLAAAETNPSARASAAGVTAPMMLVAGSRDSITPVADHQRPIYVAKPAPKQLRTIVGGSHCGFMDSGGLFCDSGAIDRATQLRLTRRLLTDWLLLYLDGDASRETAVWGAPAQTDPQVTFQGER